MTLPTQPVTLTVEQIAELNRRLSNMRHDINNQLSLILAATELIRAKPHMAERMTATLAEQPSKITATLMSFTTEFEKAFGIQRK
jgi:aspartokinase